MYYDFGKKSEFLKIITQSPKNVATLRKVFETGFNFDNVIIKEMTYESNIPYALRFMIDRGITGMSWIEVPGKKFSIVPSDNKVSHCQIELEVEDPMDVIGHSYENPMYTKIASLRILSFDIECMNQGNHMPQANKDPIVTICCVLQGHDKAEPYLRQVFSLKECAPVIGTNVKSFKTEKELLYAWETLMIETDPDIITGYNTYNFDFPYILERAHTLGLKNYGKLSRIIKTTSKVTSNTFSSKALGTRESKETYIEGRVQMDMLQIILTETKLPSYTLNSVSRHFLSKQKEEVHHSMINRLFEKDEFSRRKLALYCLKDAYLALELMNKLLSVYNVTEMARVTGVPASYIFKRGQQVRVASQLYRRTRDEGFIIPCIHFEKGTDDGIQYEGATVIKPLTGFYEKPVTTLDFASLYPSVMIAHNICYTTLVPSNKISQLSPAQYQKSPSGDYFVRKEVKEGLLPSILEKILEARKRAKDLAAKEEDQLTKMVLDSRQLALKISANSVYGFTGAVRGILPCLAISSSVTAYGREMILETKKSVEEHYIKENGYKCNAEVIYGDTDSVMILFGVDNVKEAMELGKDAGARVTKKFMRPIKLDYEKVYDPYLLLTKKRYAGLLFDNDPNKYRKLDAKGIETVRRDNCLLVKDLVNTSLELIIKKRDKEGALNYCKEMISDLFLGKIDISNLIITKGIGKRTEENKDASKSKYKAKQAHVALANRMKEENNGKNLNNVRCWTKCR